MVACAGIGVVSLGIYVKSASATPMGVTGASSAGLFFGALAFLVMISESFLAVKNRRPAWRLGRGSTWMKGHVWLGLLVLPLALLHSGFRVHGSGSKWMIGLLSIVTLSGLLGVALQQVLPRVMTIRVPLETVYEQIPEVIARLRQEAGKIVENAAHETLTRFFQEDVESFLAQIVANDHRLFDPAQAERVFARLKKLLPSEQHEALADLQAICQERAQLRSQERMHHWLHGWLLVHVPLSYALLLLTAAHAVVTLLY